MGSEVVNRNRSSVFHGDYVGRDNITVNIVMFQDSERKFVVTHNADIKPVSYFTGRETELQELRQRIEEGRKSVLVSGMGGIGKTHICRKLFEEYFKNHTGPFRHIGYIEYSGDMGSSLQNCLKFKEQDNPKQNQEAAWRELEYLASDGKLLLFIDNVDNTIGADPGLQRLRSIPGAVVLTSRLASFSDEFEPYPIGFLDIEQCKEIYEKIRFRGSEKKIRSEEVADLEYILGNLAGRHTITVELLAHLAYTKTWSVKRLREELEEKGFQLQFHKDGELVNIQESCEKLYDLSTLTEAEQNILEAFSVFPYIPLPVETCNRWLLVDAGAREEDDVLVGLYQKGWLQFDMEQESYSLHPVFAKFIYEKCSPRIEEHKGMIESCQKYLKIPENGFVLECQRYIPFAENMVQKLGMENDLEQVSFIVDIAYLLYYVGEYKKAEILNKRVMQIREKALGEEHVDTATSYSNLAVMYKKQGEYKKAETFYKRSIQIRERELGEEHVDTAISYMNLARLYEDRGEYKKAQDLYEKSLRINEKVLGEEHSITAINYISLAGLYEAQGKYKKAQDLYEKSLWINEKVLGEEHPNTAVSYNNLAELYFNQRKYELALFYFIKAYKICINKLGFGHPRTKSSHKNIKITYAKWRPEGNFELWLEEQMKEQ